jgi:hypothetical protein
VTTVETYTASITATINDVQRAWLEAMAKFVGCRKSEIVRQCIDRTMAEAPCTGDPTTDELVAWYFEDGGGWTRTMKALPTTHQPDGAYVVAQMMLRLDELEGSNELVQKMKRLLEDEGR